MSQSINLSPLLADYLLKHNIEEHPVLKKCRIETAANYPRDAWLQISPEQASFMQFLFRIAGVQHVVELGTFTGYSSLAFALAIRQMRGSDGTVRTIDNRLEYLQTAQAYWEEAGVDDIAIAEHGAASDVLDRLIRDAPDSCDAIFIDADKEPVIPYYEQALRLLRKGGLIIIDNILWDGKVADPSIMDAATVALRDVATFVRRDTRVMHNICAIGDGLLFAQKL